MKIGILKETQKGERRVCISPIIAKQLIEKGFEILVEEDAGVNSSFKNSDYEKIGATVEIRGVVFKEAKVLVKINPFDEEVGKDITSPIIVTTGLLKILGTPSSPWAVDIQKLHFAPK